MSTFIRVGGDSRSLLASHPEDFADSPGMTKGQPVVGCPLHIDCHFALVYSEYSGHMGGSGPSMNM